MARAPTKPGRRPPAQPAPTAAPGSAPAITGGSATASAPRTAASASPTPASRRTAGAPAPAPLSRRAAGMPAAIPPPKPAAPPRPDPAPAVSPAVAPALASPLASGSVTIALPRRQGAAPLGLLLDDLFEGELAAGPGERTINVRLPAHRLPSWLDIVDLADGRTVLERRVDLRPRFGLVLHALALEGLEIAGRFTLGGPDAAHVARHLAVELLDGTRIAAAGIAAREGDTPDASYGFRLPLAMLPPRNGALTLVPRIGGALLPATLPVTPAEIGIVGMLDGLSPGGIAGWAMDLRDPARRVPVSLVIDGEVVAEAVADGVRHDLLSAGVGDGFHGVEVPLPAEHRRERRVGLLVAGTALHLSGGPVTLLPSPAVVGCFDTFHGLSAHGWAFDHLHPDRKVVVEAVAAGERVLGRATAEQFRGDLLDAGIAGGYCAFKIDLGAHFLALVGQPVAVRVVSTGDFLPGSPRTVTPNPNLLRFVRRRDRLTPNSLARLRRRLNHAASGRGISLVMPVHDTRAEWLIQSISSVLAQWCDRWELICIDDGSTEPHVAPLLAHAAARDPRIRVLRSAENVGIARAVNFGLRAARHAHVAFLDHDDALEPDAVWQLLRAIIRTDADFLYSDEALTDESIDAITEPRARPAFSHDYYLSHPYVVHMLCIRTDLARRMNGWDERLSISADVDFFLRATEHARQVVHVPAVLYRWRTHAGSTGHSKQSDVMAATRGAIQAHLDRTRPGATVSDGVWFNQFRIDWPAAPGLVLVVIPTKNRHELVRACIESIERTADASRLRIVVIDHQSDDPAARRYLRTLAKTHVVMPYAGPFNYAAMNNAAVRAHGEGCDFVLFLNNDIEAIQPGWIDRMASLAQRPDVGAVGALLMYADHRVQHAGVILGFNGSAEHAFKFTNVWLDGGTPEKPGRRNLGTNCALTSVRDYSAVTAACLMTRRAAFEAVGGFDESFAIGFNDTDFCLRLRAAGLRVLYDGHTMLYHHESATRSTTKQVFHPEDTARLLDRWAGLLRDGDPFYSPLLSDRTQDHVLREDDGCRIVHAPRVTTLRNEAEAGKARGSAPMPESGNSAKGKPPGSNT